MRSMISWFNHHKPYFLTLVLLLIFLVKPAPIFARDFIEQFNTIDAARAFSCPASGGHAHITSSPIRVGDPPFVKWTIECKEASSPLGVITQPDALKGFGAGEAGIAKFIRIIIGLLVITAVILAFVSLLIGGIGFISAGGDKAKVESARGRIIWAVVGLVVVFAAFAIIRFVETIFGVSIISGTFNIPGV